MALTSRQKKQGAALTVAVGALTLGGVAVATLGTPAAPGDTRPVAAAAVPQPASTLNAVPESGPGASGASGTSSTGTITVTATADNAKPGDDTVFTVSGEVKGAQPGTKIRLQRQSAPTSAKSSPVWSTLAYTTFTDKSNKFSFPVKMEASGSYNLRILHPQDHEGSGTAYSAPFAVTVSGTTNSGASATASSAASKASSAASKASSKASSAISSAKSQVGSKAG